jgi:Tfp pilus assembly protein PilX
MMKRSIWEDQKGVALIVALIILLVLTLIGMSAISSTFFETKISGTVCPIPPLIQEILAVTRPIEAGQ